MKFLIDKSPADVTRRMQSHPELVAGQLLTPLTRYKNAGGIYAIDNGAFSGFDPCGFARLLHRQEPHRDRCLFAVVPDIVGNGRRTLELWRHRDRFIRDWPLALVAQDGMEELEIPWSEVDALFIGGNDPWKESSHSIDLVKTAKTLGKHVHIGRVNTPRRYRLFAVAGADTCDGSGVAMYDHMLDEIHAAVTPQPMLWD